MRHDEETMQEGCVRWFSLQYRNLALLLHHSPNGGRRSIREGARFKAMGTRRGFPDLFLFVPSRQYHGLAIELKTEEGRQSPSQKLMQQRLESVGYRYCVCRSFDDFKATIEDYLYINFAD